MYSLLITVIMIGCYLFYITSKRAQVGKIPFRLSELAKNKKKCYLLGSSLLLLAGVAVVYHQGIGSGIFAFGSYIMMCLCLILMLNPLKYLNWKHFAFLVALSSTIEFFLY